MSAFSVSRRLLLLTALLAGSGAASLATAPAEARVRVSANWELRPDNNPIHGRDAIGLATNPRDPKHVVAVYADWASLWCETAVSFNGGRTWQRRRLKTPPGFVNPPCTVGAHLANQLDGSIVFGGGRRVYTTFASSLVNAQGLEQGKSVLVARSDDGGRTFGTARVVMPGGADPDTEPDHSLPKLAVVAGTTRGRDRLHLVANLRYQASGRAQEDIAYARSGDGGASWSRARSIDATGNNIEVSQPVVGRGQRVFVAWRHRTPGARPGTSAPEGVVVVARSSNGGATWTEKGVAGVRGFVYEGPRVAPFAGAQVFTASTFPRLASDPRSNSVYLVYNNGGRPSTPGALRAADHFIHPDSDVWFQRSNNGGSSWSAAVKINDELEVPTEITQTRHPNIAVAPNGRVDIAWQDRRHWYRGCLHTHSPCVEARLGDTYYTWSNDRGATFAPDRRITDHHINLDVGYDYRFGTYWDYSPAIAHQGDDRLLVGWMDSRRGNVETDTQGIFLAGVRHGSRAVVPVSRLRAPDAAGLAVRLSQRSYQGGPEAVLGGTFASRPWSRVVIVNERDAASALAGGVLARATIAPVLLSSSRGLDRATKDELARLAPIGAYVIGSRRSLSDAVIEDLAATGIPREGIVRLEGTSRADTARLIAQGADRRTDAEQRGGRPAFDAAILVNPDSDAAYAAATLAAARRLPVLFTGRTSRPAATTQALGALGINRVLVAGGERAVAAPALAGLTGVQRLGGADAVATSRRIATESRRRGLPTNQVFAADTRMGSALLGATVARIGGLQLYGGRATLEDQLRRLRLSGAVDRVVHLSTSGR